MSRPRKLNVNAGDVYGDLRVLEEFIMEYPTQKTRAARCECTECGSVLDIPVYRLVENKLKGCRECRYQSSPVVQGYTHKYKNVIDREGDRVTFRCVVCGGIFQSSVYVFRKSESCRSCSIQAAKFTPFLFVGDQPFSARQCAKILGVSRQRVYQMNPDILQSRMHDAVLSKGASS